MPVQVDIELCDACLKCADACPNHCIEKGNNGTKDHAEVKPDDCIDCYLCITECEKGALTQA
jgi:NAD-dependent dihydropyrimidine dehydrogenase PreA subunit